jgi:pimeloyl-ACP methyl ester carboxylesterase
MYVHYRIPVGMKAVPIVMVHGSNHTGMIYGTTPDGREGWGTYFVRRGFPVYVVDHAGRGRSGFNPTIVNQVRDAPAFRASSRSSTKRSSRSSSKDSNRDSSADVLPTLFVGTHERAWQNFRFGPSYGVPFPNVQFPVETVDQYFAQLVPNTETTLANGAVNTVDALAALLDKIGSAVVIVHSQSGVYGLDLVRERGQLVRGLISIEGGCEGVTPAVAGANFTSVPFVSFGAITASAQRTP